MNKNELFIVEGKSASSALRLASDNKSQRVYAIQGKLANIGKMSHDAVAENHECQQLFNKLGGDFASQYQVDNLPDSHVLILMDPDIDGSHSSALVLTLIGGRSRVLLRESRMFGKSDGNLPGYLANSVEG